MDTRDLLGSADSDDDALEGTMIGTGARPITQFVADGIITLPPSTTLRDAAVTLRDDDISLVAVGEDGVIDGVVSERDLVNAIAMDLDLDVETVGAIASNSLRWASVTSTVDDVAEEMLETYLRHILVRHEDGSLAGVVSMRDLLTAYLV